MQTMKKIKFFLKAIIKLPEIVKGIYRKKFKSFYIENRFRYRLKICKGCWYYTTDKSKCLSPLSKHCCAICGCDLEYKLRSDDICPLSKWN